MEKKKTIWNTIREDGRLYFEICLLTFVELFGIFEVGISNQTDLIIAIIIGCIIISLIVLKVLSFIMTKESNKPTSSNRLKSVASVGKI